MNDELILELLSRSCDETLDPASQQELDAALASSQELRDLAADLATLKDLATEPAPACPDLDFAALAHEVERTYGRRRFRLLPGRWVTPVLALAALLVMALLGLLRPSELQSEAAELDAIREQVMTAQEEYHTAIAKMESIATSRLAQMPPEIALSYTRNLEVINQAIRDCELLSDQHPGSGINYAALSQSYGAKIKLLEMIIEG